MFRVKYYIIHKPFGFLSQFSRELPEHRTLADLGNFPKDVYPVGRLDKDSEGLLILTNDKQLTHRLLHPDFHHRRTYLAQVEGIPTPDAIRQLAGGVDIKLGKKKYHTRPCSVRLMGNTPDYHGFMPAPRTPPIRFRKNNPTSWLELTLTEGKNRQVRKMCARAGFPVLRLIRVAIEKLELGDLPIGGVKPLTRTQLFPLLFE
ncbi:MAG: pseudouridine synthase [Bacteroidetes bacterium]|nr:MAG: pseudouridine synthase [Bacteroidota bacterium]